MGGWPYHLWYHLTIEVSAQSRLGARHRKHSARCLDHVIPLGEDHLRRVLREYVEYYNESRCHMSLEGDSPRPRRIEDGKETVPARPTHSFAAALREYEHGVGWGVES